VAKPVLYIFVGYPGSGKTTVAKIIAEMSSAEHLWADHERHKMFNQPTHAVSESRRLYAHLNQVTDRLLSQGLSVIFDTNFNYYSDRQHLRQIAKKRQAKTILIWLTTPLAIARARATEHSHNKETRIWGNMPPEVFDRMSSQLELPKRYEAAIQIDGTNINRENLKQQLAHLLKTD